MKNPAREWNVNEGDHNLDFMIEGTDFDQIQNLVGVSFPPTGQLKNESFADYENRLKERYLKTTKEKGYEMLGRFSDFYDDVVYRSSEVEQLRQECLKEKNKQQNLDAIIALDKIINACNEALYTNSGIFFGCD